MHEKYRASVDQIRDFAENESGIKGVVLLGSQVRAVHPGDEWSDLDVLILADEPSEYVDSDGWLGSFGTAACVRRETAELSWIPLTWQVKRVLYDDSRAMDFSILPYGRLNEVLDINKEIHALGCRVLQDGTGGRLSSLIEESVRDVRQPVVSPMNAGKLENLANDILFSVIYCFKKIKRNELWVAVNEINGRIAPMVLRLTEAYNTVVSGRTDVIDYDGRLLENRTDADILAMLASCIAGYDAGSAVRALEGILRAAGHLCREIGAKIGCGAYEPPFEAVGKLFRAM